MSTVNLPDARLFYEILGEGGDPTVLVHGSPGDHHVWDRVAPGLARSLHVLTYDRRGHGGSTGLRRSHPVRDDAGDLGALLEAVDHYPVHVVAHSYASAVAVRLVVERPELVRSLALHEPPFVGLLETESERRPEIDAFRRRLRTLAESVREGRPQEASAGLEDPFLTAARAGGELSPELRASFARDPDGWVEELEDPSAIAPASDELASIDVPVLVTAGERSPKLLRSVAEALERTLPNGRLTVLPGSGHLPQLTDPDQYAGILGMFLLERDVPST